MSVLGDAVAGIKKVLRLEERIQSQGRKLEQLSSIVVDIDKRLARLEGFVAGAAAAGDRHRGMTSSPPAAPRIGKEGGK